MALALFLTTHTHTSCKLQILLYQFASSIISIIELLDITTIGVLEPEIEWSEKNVLVSNEIKLSLHSSSTLSE